MALNVWVIMSDAAFVCCASARADIYTSRSHCLTVYKPSHLFVIHHLPEFDRGHEMGLIKHFNNE